MISADSIVQVLDMELPVAYEFRISDVFAKYIERAKTSANCQFYTPVPGSLKIRDLRGWTDVTKIIAHYNPPGYTFAEIKTKHTEPLYVSRDQFIPVYSRKAIRGFHGEVKYEFRKCSARLFYDGIIKSLRTSESVFLNSDTVSAVHIEDECWTYAISTKSGFFNANDIHLLSAVTNFDRKNMYK